MLNVTWKLLTQHKLSLQNYQLYLDKLGNNNWYFIFFLGILTQDVINNLFLNVLCAEHLMKEETLGLSFTIVLFRTWIEEKGIINVGSVLRKTKLENQLLVS